MGEALILEGKKLKAHKTMALECEGITGAHGDATYVASEVVS